MTPCDSRSRCGHSTGEDDRERDAECVDRHVADCAGAPRNVVLMELVDGAVGDGERRRHRDKSPAERRPLHHPQRAEQHHVGRLSFKEAHEFGVRARPGTGT